MSYTERIAHAIKDRKFYHVFIDGTYFKSFYHHSAASCYRVCYKHLCSIVRLSGGR